MELKYPQWQEPLASAILEFNREQLREMVQKAEEAIAQRIERLASVQVTDTNVGRSSTGWIFSGVQKKDRLGIPEAKGEESPRS